MQAFSSPTRILWIIFNITSVLTGILSVTANEMFTNCGGLLEGAQGTISSPMFPGPFPVPLACRWVIHAPPNKKIVLHFTQYFLKGAFHVTEYERYVSESLYMGRNSLGQIDIEDDIRLLVAYKPYLVLNFQVHEMANIHVRVEEFLENVYGFNITYEVLNRTDTVRQDRCSVQECSFLGHCLASADFSRYDCVCFPGFFGKECQFGPYCDPDQGINMCFNGGQCRYIYGSTVNICDCKPGFTGLKCEEEEAIVDNDCFKMGCSDKCERTSEGRLHCTCQDGFKLDTDNVTCIEQELYRVSVTVPVLNISHSVGKEVLKHEMTSLLQKSGLQIVKRLYISDFNSSSLPTVLRFHFYGETSDSQAVSRTIASVMSQSDVFNLTVLSTEQTVQIDPEMKLVSLENYDPSPSFEKKSLTLVCAAKGSPKLRFRWFKDGHLFNSSLTKRNAWELRLQDDVSQRQFSIFNIDGVTAYDKGDFECEIEDFEEQERRAIRVDVVLLPQVIVKPLTVSLLPGQRQSFRCLSPDENMRTFSYQWFRNGEAILDRANGELVEDLLPSGSRLLLNRITMSANYSCRVTNSAGTSSRTVFVFVTATNASEAQCASEAYHGIQWNVTYGGFFDLQSCPMDTADFNVVRRDEEFARRDCVCEMKCVWTPPNYARCHSIHLKKLYEQLEEVQMGYDQGGLSKIYDSLYDVVQRAQNRMLSGDVDMFARNLHTVLDVTLRFPALAPLHFSHFSLETVAKFMNILLTEVKHTSDFEKKDLTVGVRLVQICEILASLVRRGSSHIIPLRNITLPALALLVQPVTFCFGHPSTPTDDGGRLRVCAKLGATCFTLFRQPSCPPPQTHRESAGLPQKQPKTEKMKDIRFKDVTLETVHATAETQSSETSPFQTPHPAPSNRQDADFQDFSYIQVLEYRRNVLQVTFSPDIIPVMYTDTTERSHNEVFLTSLVSIIPVDNEANDYNDTLKNGKVELEFRHDTQKPIFVENITKCVSWNLPESPGHRGYWSSSNCHVTLRTFRVTRCFCPIPGHYAVVITETNSTEIAMEHVTTDTALLVGCVTALCGLAAVLITYIIVWRHICGGTSLIHINVVLALIAVNMLCIVCLGQAHQQLVCNVGKVLLHFFQLTAFSFMLMDAVHMFIKIQSTSLSGRVRHNVFNYLLFGWGLPVAVTLAVFLVSEMFDYNTCNGMCWLSLEHWRLYSFIVPFCLVVLAQIIIMAVCLVRIRKWKDEWRYRDRKLYIYSALRAYSLQVLLVLLCISGMMSEVKQERGRHVFFTAINILLTLTVIVTMGILRPRVRDAVVAVIFRPRGKHNKGMSFNSFKAFILPGRVEESGGSEAKQIQDFCLELNKAKFTSERKQQLRFLLGTSGSSSSASGTEQIE